MIDNKPTRTNGQSGKDERYFQWDRQLGEIEVYDSNGKHAGAVDPFTGKMIKPASPKKVPLNISAIDDQNSRTSLV